MDTSNFLNSIRKIIREEVRTVIKQELTDILKEGLKPTLTELNQQPNRTVKSQPITNRKPVPVREVKTTPNPVLFSDNKWANILNETPILREQSGNINSYSEMLNEEMDDIHMTSADAMNFGMLRQPTSKPSVMEDPETGKVYDVAPAVQDAMTRDYSSLMKAIAAKKGN
jgi:hypothetical protein